MFVVTCKKIPELENIVTEIKIDEQVKASEFCPKAILEILGKIGVTVREVVEL